MRAWTPTPRLQGVRRCVCISRAPGDALPRLPYCRRCCQCGIGMRSRAPLCVCAAGGHGGCHAVGALVYLILATNSIVGACAAPVPPRAWPGHRLSRSQQLPCAAVAHGQPAGGGARVARVAAVALVPVRIRVHHQRAASPARRDCAILAAAHNNRADTQYIGCIVQPRPFPGAP